MLFLSSSSSPSDRIDDDDGGGDGGGGGDDDDDGDVDYDDDLMMNEFLFCEAFSLIRVHFQAGIVHVFSSAVSMPVCAGGQAGRL